MPKSSVSVVIRTKNEEKWIRSCLTMIFSQENFDPKVVIVDNQSVDNTLKIARTFPIEKVLVVEDYTPGKALNIGASESDTEFVAFISAHCVPIGTSWLETLLRPFADPEISGVYGQQLPLPLSDPIDKNDLMMAFGVERRIQRKDWFFHNANSAIRKSIWDDYPFDENVGNIEDRLWAKSVIDAGYAVIYEPEAQVFHHNGLHRTVDSSRVRKHVEVIERATSISAKGPSRAINPSHLRVVGLVPVGLGDSETAGFRERFTKKLDSILQAEYVQTVYQISAPSDLIDSRAELIDRTVIPESYTVPLELLLSQAARIVEQSTPPDFYLYVNWQSQIRESKFYDLLVEQACLGGFDSVFEASSDFGHYWSFDENKSSFYNLDPSLKNNRFRKPTYKANYGAGTLVSAAVLRQENLPGGRVGIIETEGTILEDLQELRKNSAQ